MTLLLTLVFNEKNTEKVVSVPGRCYCSVHRRLVLQLAEGLDWQDQGELDPG